ncbi:alkene reductase [Rhodococcus sp. 15-1154-1]|nr:alkene reductase [Rhodococcus sp. 15-1154-1]OZF02580.1 alkene reductase [Rhodococcus sp. 15-1154-1]
MSLFETLPLGTLKLPNRIVMAPLTRVRCGESGVPDDLTATYYRQRASFGLIITEGIYPSREGQGFTGQPGIVDRGQIEGWKRVTEAVHSDGGRIYAQIMHAGRVTHPEISGHPPLAPSPIAMAGVHVRAGDHKHVAVQPREMSVDDLARTTDDFVDAARTAIGAGFDGVELHGANGYLLHEFLAADSNHRVDGYGGDPRSRASYVIEIAQRIASEIGARRVGVRISPQHNIKGIVEDDSADSWEPYRVLTEALSSASFAYLSILHAEPASAHVQDLRHRFGGPVLMNSGFAVTTELHEAAALVPTKSDAVVVGRLAISNPDLPYRWQNGLALNEPNRSTFYTPGAEGYIDYPSLSLR